MGGSFGKPKPRRGPTDMTYASGAEWCDETAVEPLATAADGTPPDPEVFHAKWREAVSSVCSRFAFPPELISIIAEYAIPFREIRFDKKKSSNSAGICNSGRSLKNQKFGWREGVSELPLKYYSPDFAVRLSLSGGGVVYDPFRPPGDVLVGVTRFPFTDIIDPMGGDAPDVIGGTSADSYCIDVATGRLATNGRLQTAGIDELTPPERWYNHAVSEISAAVSSAGTGDRKEVLILNRTWEDINQSSSRLRQISPLIFTGSVCRVHADLATDTLSFKLQRIKNWKAPYTPVPQPERDPPLPPTPEVEECDAGSWVVRDLANCHIFASTDGPMGANSQVMLSIRSE